MIKINHPNMGYVYYTITKITPVFEKSKREGPPLRNGITFHCNGGQDTIYVTIEPRDPDCLCKEEQFFKSYKRIVETVLTHVSNTQSAVDIKDLLHNVFGKEFVFNYYCFSFTHG